MNVLEERKRFLSDPGGAYVALLDRINRLEEKLAELAKPTPKKPRKRAE